MPFGAYLIKYNACKAHVLIEMEEALQQRSHRIGSTPGIGHQHDGDIQQLSNLRRRTPVAVVAVEQPHHTLHDADVSPLGIACKDLAHMLVRGHERIEVDAGSSAYRLMKLGVDIVWAALEGLYPQSLPGQQLHQPPGNSRLARATHRCCNQES